MNSKKTAYFIIKKLCSNGYEAYIAGGATRDLLSGADPEDIDIVTNASYKSILHLFKNRRPDIVGGSFPVCLIDGIEIATYRGKTISDDLARRDLTINAMACCPHKNEIIDIYGGQSDLSNKIIRFTGCAEERIFEDPCRIIRACRFLAKIEGRFDPDTRDVLIKNGSMVQQVAPERIRLELLKVMKYKNPGLFFDALRQIDVLKYVSQGFDKCYGHDGGCYHNETVDCHIKITGNSISPKKPLLRLAGYFHDHGKPVSASYDTDRLSFIGHELTGSKIVQKELFRLKFSKKEINYVKGLTLLHMRSLSKETSPKAIRKLLKDLKDSDLSWKDWLVLKIADRKANLKKNNYSPADIKFMVMALYRELNPLHYARAFSIKDLAISGSDVMNTLHIKQSKEVGAILCELLNFVMDDPTRNTKETLLAYLFSNRGNLGKT